MYNHVVFPFFIGFYWISSLTTTIMIDHKKLSLFSSLTPVISSLINFLFLFILSLIFFYESKGLFTFEKNSHALYGLAKCHRTHIPCYLFFILIVNICLTVQYMGIFQYSQLPIIILNLIFFLCYCTRKPYKSKLHNAGLIYNLLMVLIFGVWTVLRNIVSALQDEDKEILIIFVFFLLMVGSILISMGRTIV